MSNYYLEHYGVVGMRWGKRKQRTLDRPTIDASYRVYDGDGPSSSSSSRSSNSSSSSSSRSSNSSSSSSSRSSNSSSSSSSRSSNSSSSSSSRSSNQGSNNNSSNSSTQRPNNNSSNTNRERNNNESNQTTQQQSTKSKSIDTKLAKDGLGAGKKLSDIGVKKLKEERESKLEKQLKESTKDMTNAEMQEVITRLNMEQRYVDVMKKNTDPEPKSNLEKTLEIAGAVATHAETALSVYETIQKIRGR